MTLYDYILQLEVGDCINIVIAVTFYILGLGVGYVMSLQETKGD